MDPIRHVIEIVRERIISGEIPYEMDAFEDALMALKGNELEDYLQEAWDHVQA
jgi:hypothetical protein